MRSNLKTFCRVGLTVTIIIFVVITTSTITTGRGSQQNKKGGCLNDKDSFKKISQQDSWIPKPEQWGNREFLKLCDTVKRLAEDRTLRAHAIATALVISQIPNGSSNPGNEIALSLTKGMGNGSCTRRAQLMASVLYDAFSDISMRLAGMGSVPAQGSHTFLEVFLPSQNSWAYFDPSSSVFFTERGWNSRILSSKEVYADPNIVDRVGPWVAKSQHRLPNVAAAFEMNGSAHEYMHRVPGFSSNRYPLLDMYENARWMGSMDAGEVHINKVKLAAGETIAFRNDNAPAFPRLKVKRNGILLTQGDIVGMVRGAIFTQAYVLYDLEPDGQYILDFLIYHPQDIVFYPVCLDDCRIAKIECTDLNGQKNLRRVKVYLHARDTRALVVLWHSEKQPNRKIYLVSVGLYEDHKDLILPKGIGE